MILVGGEGGVQKFSILKKKFYKDNASQVHILWQKLASLPLLKKIIKLNFNFFPNRFQAYIFKQQEGGKHNYLKKKENDKYITDHGEKIQIQSKAYL